MNDYVYEDIFKNRLAILRTQRGVSAREMSLSLGQNAGYINDRIWENASIYDALLLYLRIS